MSNHSDLTNEQIEARINEILAAYTALGITEESGEDALAQAEALATEITGLRNEIADRSNAAKRLSDLGAIFQPEPEPVVEPEPVADAAPEPSPASSPEPALEPVAASAPRVSPVVRAAANAPLARIAPPAAPAAAITAAADVPNFSAGQQLEGFGQAVDAIISRARSLPTHFAPNTRLRYGAVNIQKMGYGDLVQGHDGDDYNLIQRAGNEKRLSGGSRALTADAWCAPSETLYDLCQYETASQLLSLPEIQVTRGGIRYSTGPDFSSIFGDKDFYFTVSSAGVIKDGSGATVATKPCGDIDCPTFTEERLAANGVCISVNILQNVAYPELTQRVIEGVLVAHQRKVNAANIVEIETAAGAPIAVEDNSTLLFNLDYLEWYAEVIRTTYSLAENATIEGVVPAWAKALIRAELARRNGVDYVNVSDAFISAYFSVRGISLQFVRDWQMVTGLPGKVAIPSNLKVLLYPAGSWVRGSQSVISLDTIYDSTMLAQNKYIGLFTEEASLLVQRCLGTTALNIPVKVSGLTGAQVTEALGTDATP